MMDRFLGKYSEIIYAVTRLVLGVLFACHGAQKLFGVLGGQSQLSDPMMVTAGIIEFVGGGLVAVGLWAGFAAFVASGTMAVAYFIAHAPDGIWPIVNNGELAVLYCFVFLYFASRGSGRMSIDAYRHSRRTRRHQPKIVPIRTKSFILFSIEHVFSQFRMEATVSFLVCPFVCVSSVEGRNRYPGCFTPVQVEKSGYLVIYGQSLGSIKEGDFFLWRA